MRKALTPSRPAVMVLLLVAALLLVGGLLEVLQAVWSSDGTSAILAEGSTIPRRPL